MIQQLTIPGRLMGLNEYTAWCRYNKHAGNRAKQDEQALIEAAIMAAKIKPVENPVMLHYLWIEPNERRDKDNIAFGKKFIQDALVACGILPDDGWKWVDGFTDDFAVDKQNPRIEVNIREVLA